MQINDNIKFKIQCHETISNEICCECWKHVDDFHKFWLNIDEKQKTLQNHLECIETKHLIEDIETEEFPSAHINSSIDCKEIGLREPQIDLAILQPDICDNEVEFDAAELDNDYEDEVEFDAADIDNDVSSDQESSSTLKAQSTNNCKLLLLLFLII